MLPLPPGSAAAVASLPTGIERTKGESAGGPQTIMPGTLFARSYHTQVIQTVPYISTLQLPGVVHVGRSNSVFTEFEINACAII